MSSLVFAASLVMSGTAHAVQSEMRQARAARFWFLRRPFGRAAWAFWRFTTEAKGSVRGMRRFQPEGLMPHAFVHVGAQFAELPGRFAFWFWLDRKGDV